MNNPTIAEKVQEHLKYTEKVDIGFSIWKTVPQDWSEYTHCDICERKLKETNLKSLSYTPEDPAYSTGLCLDCLKELVRLLESGGQK